LEVSGTKTPSLIIKVHLSFKILSIYFQSIQNIKTSAVVAYLTDVLYYGNIIYSSLSAVLLLVRFSSFHYNMYICADTVSRSWSMSRGKHQKRPVFRDFLCCP